MELSVEIDIIMAGGLHLQFYQMTGPLEKKRRLVYSTVFCFWNHVYRVCELSEGKYESK